MSNPLIAITDKVMDMTKSMVYLAMRVYYRRGATVAELSGFLADWSPATAGCYHEGMIEHVLFDLEHQGRVQRAGPRWYPAGVPH